MPIAPIEESLQTSMVLASSSMVLASLTRVTRLSLHPGAPTGVSLLSRSGCTNWGEFAFNYGMGIHSVKHKMSLEDEWNDDLSLPAGCVGGGETV